MYKIRRRDHAGHAYFVSWIPDMNIVYRRYYRQIFCMDPDQNKMCITES